LYQRFKRSEGDSNISGLHAPGETFEKCKFLFEFKEGDPPRRIDHRHTFSISRIELKLHFVQNVEPDTEIGQKGAFCKGLRGCLANEPRSTQDEISGQGSFESVFLILTTIVPERNSKKISRGRSQRPFAKQLD
jgi:hypothetical protein